MTVLVEIPLALYQAFIGRCGLDSREYGVLRNAIIAHVPKYLRDGNVATLLCTEDDANLLIGRAKQFYPQVVYYFEEALRSPAYRKAEFGDTSHPAPSNTKTLGGILFADSSKLRSAEDEWLQLVRAVGRGDQRALHALYEQTHGIVYTLIVRIIANREIAEEVTLAVFHDVWREASNYDPANGPVVRWIMNQARSAAIDRQRCAPVDRSFAGDSAEVLRPAESLWGRLADRIAGEAATPPFVPLQGPANLAWEEAAPGIHVQILARNAANDSVSMLVRLDPGTDYPGHTHAGIEELHLLHGVLKVDDRTLHAGDFIHSEAGSVDRRVWSETGCTCFLMTSTNDVLF